MSMWLYIRKGHGLQHCLQMMLETWKKGTNNKNKAFVALLTNLSKEFICWSDNLLIANFYGNGLDLRTLRWLIVVRLKSIFGQISPPFFHYHFPLLQEFDLKKPCFPFKDLDKFLKPILAISFPLTVRHRKIAFENVTRP